MVNVAILIGHIVEFSITFLFFETVFQAKRKKLTAYLLGLLIYAAVFIMYFAFNSTMVNIATGTIFNFAFGLLFYRCKIKDVIFSALFLTVSLTAAEFIVILLTSFSTGGGINSFKSSFSACLLATLFSRTIYLIITSSVGHVLQKNRMKKTPFFLFLFPIASTVVLYTLYIISMSVHLPNHVNYMISGAGFAVVASILLTYVFYGKTNKELNELYKAQNENIRAATDAAYYSVLDRQNEQLKTILHDEKNHLTTIKCLANNQEVSEYIDRIYGQIVENSLFGNTKNKILDLTINKYQYICEAQNIEFYVSIKTANLSHIEASDLTTLLGNLLDNAVDAAMASKSKKIDLSLNHVNGFEILTCTNSCDIAPETLDDCLITTKQSSGFHGLGVNSMKKIVKKYRGTFEWSYNAQNNEFSVFIAF